MARSEVATPFYIRNQAGDAFYVETLEEALAEICSEHYGYRLTLSAGGRELVIRRTSELTDNLLGEKEGTAGLTFRTRE
jgi:hypothetical protein